MSGEAAPCRRPGWLPDAPRQARRRPPSGFLLGFPLGAEAELGFARSLRRPSPAPGERLQRRRDLHGCSYAPVHSGARQPRAPSAAAALPSSPLLSSSQLVDGRRQQPAAPGRILTGAPLTATCRIAPRAQGASALRQPAARPPPSPRGGRRERAGGNSAEKSHPPGGGRGRGGAKGRQGSGGGARGRAPPLAGMMTASNRWWDSGCGCGGGEEEERPRARGACCVKDGLVVGGLRSSTHPGTGAQLMLATSHRMVLRYCSQLIRDDGSFRPDNGMI